MKQLSWIVFLIYPVLFIEAQELNLEKIFKYGMFYPNYYDFYLMNDGVSYSELEAGKIMQYSLETGNETGEIFSNKWIDSALDIDDYVLSKKNKYILLKTKKEKIYRYSSKSIDYVFNREDSTLKRLYPEKIQVASFSPNSKKIAFVCNNNIYIKNIVTEEITQVTKDGKKNKIINGIPDWVYEEEFAFSKALAWSSDSKYLAFYRFDESEVKEYFLPLYQQNLYPDCYKYKYPKAGEKNSKVSIKVFNTENNTTQIMDIGQEIDQYIPRIKWTGDGKTLGIIRLNRMQNNIEVLLADAISGKTKTVYSEKSEYYITEVGDDYIFFIPKDKQFIIKSERNGFMHLYLHDYNGEIVTQITDGKWEVDEVKDVDFDKKLIYYTSTEKSPLQRHFFSISYQGENKKQLSEFEGTNEVLLSKNSKYYINFFSSLNDPGTISIHDKNGKLIRIIDTNKTLRMRMEEYKFQKKEIIQLPREDGTILYGYILKPFNFKKFKKYPVFAYVYGGPGSQTAKDRWNYLEPWHQYLAQQGYFVVCIDNRGTGGRGESFKKITYKQLGKYETEDQIAFARYLSNLKYVDKNRIGIFGWSYGGYLTLLCMMKGEGIFKSGIAVAPVTNWRFYDTIYTERYMGKPQDNPEGYDQNSPIYFTDKLKGNLLLIHGMADDNVHLQNTTELINNLIASNKHFDLYMYPDKNHGITGGMTRLHLFSKISGFIINNL